MGAYTIIVKCTCSEFYVFLDFGDYIVSALRTLVCLLATILKCFDKQSAMYHNLLMVCFFLSLSILFLKYIEPNSMFHFIEDTFH